MALIGNYSVLSKHPGRDIGGGSIGLGQNRSDFNKVSQARGVFSNDAWDERSGVPDGYRPPYCWVLPLKDGALAARKNISGEGDLVGAVAGGKNAEAVIAGVGTLSGTAQLIISMVAAIGGSGTISGAALQAFLQLEAALSGSGTVAGTTVLTALGHLATALGGSGTVAGTTVLTALGTLQADITVTGATLTTANVADAIWNALAASYNTAGTMGAKLNSASAAGDPWTAPLPGSYADGEAGKIVGNLLTDLLDDETIETGLTVRQAIKVIAAALAGKISGASGTTITIRSAVADDKDRIVATVDSDGNRTAITYDLTP
jgi:hypothetical protein